MQKMFAVIYFDMGTCFYMFEQKQMLIFKMLYIQNTCKILRRWDHQLTHLHVHINCSRNVSLKILKIQNFLIFYPIYIKCSLFYSKCLNYSFYWINLNLDRISSLITFTWRVIKRCRLVTFWHWNQHVYPTFRAKVVWEYVREIGT